jgi:L-alanine-DL-glutamate epimerase-like enolase superfamily enzyme
MGEDIVGRWAFADLLARGAVDVIRLDSTTMGGLSEAARVIALASVSGTPVCTHIYPEIHGHLAGAFSSVRWVEVTDPSREIDNYWRVVRSEHVTDQGRYSPPEVPGLGWSLDQASVEGLGNRAAVRTVALADVR